MYNQNRLNTVTALKSLNTIIEQMKEDLSRYILKPDHKEKFKFFKESQIKQLTEVSKQMADFLEEANQEILENYKKIAKLEETELKYQGLALYHGITFPTIQKWRYQMTLKQVIEEVKYSRENDFRQMPDECRN